MFQFSPALEMSPPLHSIPVFERFMVKQHGDIGNPWGDCVASRAVDKVTGALSPFSKLAYTPQFDTEEKLKFIVHRNGDKVECTFNVTKESVIRNVWSAWRCCWPMPLAPDAKMHVLFQKERAVQR